MKKSQIQLGESTAVIVILLVMIIVGLFIAFQFWSTGKQSDIQEQKDVDAIELATKVSYLPELHCTFLKKANSNCYDRIKLEYFSNQRANPNWQYHYFDAFGYAKISMVEVYPTSTSYVLYNNSKNTSSQSQNPIFIPSKVYDPLTDSYAFAYLEVIKYS